MSGYRQLHTKFWSDAWVAELEPESKLLFIYLFSNERASICGLYELPLRTISFETGLDRNRIREILEIFKKADKVDYDFEISVVWIKNMAKYQSTSSPKVQTRIQMDIDAVPDCLLKSHYLDTLSIPYRGVSIPSDTVSIPTERVSIPLSISNSISISDSIFNAHFRNFNGDRERQRWTTLTEAIGPVRAEEVATWAEKKEIHMTNRGGLLDSLETAAKKWTDKPVKRDRFYHPPDKPPTSEEVNAKVAVFMGEK